MEEEMDESGVSHGIFQGQEGRRKSHKIDPSSGVTQKDGGLP